MQTDRFEAWADPAGNWTVWDVEQDAPAALGRVPLIGLGAGLATALCRLMNENATRSTGIGFDLGGETMHDRLAR